VNLLEEEEEEIFPSEVEDTTEAAADEEVDTATLRKKSAEKEYKFHPHGSGKNITSFSQTLNEIVLSIQKSWDGGKDVADTLEAREKIDMKKERPQREQSMESDAKMNALEQESLDMAYKEEYKRYLGRTDLYEKNLPKALALIMKNYCTIQMVIRLKEIGDYESGVMCVDTEDT